MPEPRPRSGLTSIDCRCCCAHLSAAQRRRLNIRCSAAPQAVEPIKDYPHQPPVRYRLQEYLQQRYGDADGGE